MIIIHWLNHIMGSDYGLPYGHFAWYNLWSGFMGAVPDILLITGFWAWYASRNCHVHRCWRVGLHAVDGIPYRTCRRHHPVMNGRVTAQDIADMHQAARR